jgi:hypothetical protein
VHYDGVKAQSSIVQKFCTSSGQSLLSMPGTSKKNFSFHFKRYNLTIHAVNFFEIFCTCSPTSLVQDPMVKIPKIDFFPFFLIELEMADLSIFFEKNDLCPLGVKIYCKIIYIPLKYILML